MQGRDRLATPSSNLFSFACVARHSWEDPPTAGLAARRAWEDSDEESAKSHSSSRSDFELPAETPAQKFIGVMTSLFLSRTLNARQFCVLMHYAGAAGVAGASEFGHPPNAPFGHYQRKLSKALKEYAAEKRAYRFCVPAYDEDHVERKSHVFTARVPHEMLEAEARADPGAILRISESVEAGEFPICYDNHPVVASASGSPVLPLALFLEGVPYNQPTR